VYGVKKAFGRVFSRPMGLLQAVAPFGGPPTTTCLWKDRRSDVSDDVM
jgi:hypothetical protein